jgi:hypothetical protein
VAEIGTTVHCGLGAVGEGEVWGVGVDVGRGGSVGDVDSTRTHPVRIATPIEIPINQYSLRIGFFLPARAI